MDKESLFTLCILGCFLIPLLIWSIVDKLKEHRWEYFRDLGYDPDMIRRTINGTKHNHTHKICKRCGEYRKVWEDKCQI